MQLKITITLAGESKPYTECNFHSHGKGLKDTLTMIANGIQVTATTQVVMDGVVLPLTTGRQFCDWVKGLENI